VDAEGENQERGKVACLDHIAPPSVRSPNAFVEARVEESTAVPESPGDRDLRRGLALLALMPRIEEAADAVRDYWTWVGAFYNSERHQVTVRDWGRPLDTPFTPACCFTK
jgi:hypothetical protein